MSVFRARYSLSAWSSYTERLPCDSLNGSPPGQILSDDSPSSSFRNSAIPGHGCTIVNDSEVGSFGRVCGLQKLTQKLELCLNLEMVNVYSHFIINCIKAYRDHFSAQL